MSESKHHVPHKAATEYYWAYDDGIVPGISSNPNKNKQTKSDNRSLTTNETNSDDILNCRELTLHIDANIADFLFSEMSKEIISLKEKFCCQLHHYNGAITIQSRTSPEDLYYAGQSLEDLASCVYTNEFYHECTSWNRCIQSDAIQIKLNQPKSNVCFDGVKQTKHMFTCLAKGMTFSVYLGSLMGVSSDFIVCPVAEEAGQGVPSGPTAQQLFHYGDPFLKKHIQSYNCSYRIGVCNYSIPRTLYRKIYLLGVSDWYTHSQRRKDIIVDSLNSLLNKANMESNVTSLAIPLEFGCRIPPLQVLDLIKKAIARFLKQAPEYRQLRKISLIVTESRYLHHVWQSLNRWEISDSIQENPEAIGQSDAYISLVQSALFDEKVDAIVLPVSRTLDQSHDPLVTELLKRGGVAMETEWRTLLPRDFPVAHTVAFSAGRLYTCKQVILGNLPKSERLNKKLCLKLLLENIFKTAKTNLIRSLALPAIGTGELNYPTLMSVTEILRSCFIHAQECGVRTVKLFVDKPQLIQECDRYLWKYQEEMETINESLRHSEEVVWADCDGLKVTISHTDYFGNFADIVISHLHRRPLKQGDKIVNGLLVEGHDGYQHPWICKKIRITEESYRGQYKEAAKIAIRDSAQLITMDWKDFKDEGQDQLREVSTIVGLFRKEFIRYNLNLKLNIRVCQEMKHYIMDAIRSPKRLIKAMSISDLPSSYGDAISWKIKIRPKKLLSEFRGINLVVVTRDSEEQADAYAYTLAKRLQKVDQEYCEKYKPDVPARPKVEVLGRVSASVLVPDQISEAYRNVKQSSCPDDRRREQTSTSYFGKPDVPARPKVVVPDRVSGSVLVPDQVSEAYRNVKQSSCPDDRRRAPTNTSDIGKPDVPARSKVVVPDQVSGSVLVPDQVSEAYRNVKCPDDRRRAQTDTSNVWKPDVPARPKVVVSDQVSGTGSTLALDQISEAYKNVKQSSCPDDRRRAQTNTPDVGKSEIPVRHKDPVSDHVLDASKKGKQLSSPAFKVDSHNNTPNSKKLPRAFRTSLPSVMCEPLCTDDIQRFRRMVRDAGNKNSGIGEHILVRCPTRALPIVQEPGITNETLKTRRSVYERSTADDHKIPARLEDTVSDRVRGSVKKEKEVSSPDFKADGQTDTPSSKKLPTTVRRTLSAEMGEDSSLDDIKKFRQKQHEADTSGTSEHIQASSPTSTRETLESIFETRKKENSERHGHVYVRDVSRELHQMLSFLINDIRNLQVSYCEHNQELKIIGETGLINKVRAEIERIRGYKCEVIDLSEEQVKTMTENKRKFESENDGITLNIENNKLYVYCLQDKMAFNVYNVKTYLGIVKNTARRRRQKQENFSPIEPSCIDPEPVIAASPAQPMKLQLCVTLKVGKRLKAKVYKGSILDLNVDCVVNVKPEGSLSEIDKAAGSEILNRIQNVNKFKKLGPTTCFISNAGCLKFKKLLHVEEVRWTGYQQEPKCRKDIFTLMLVCLMGADSTHLTSIGIPALFSEEYSILHTICAQEYCRALQHYERLSNHLKEVHLVFMTDGNVERVLETSRQFFTLEQSGIETELQHQSRVHAEAATHNTSQNDHNAGVPASEEEGGMSQRTLSGHCRADDGILILSADNSGVPNEMRVEEYKNGKIEFVKRYIPKVPHESHFVDIAPALVRKSSDTFPFDSIVPITTIASEQADITSDSADLINLTNPSVITFGTGKTTASEQADKTSDSADLINLTNPSVITFGTGKTTASEQADITSDSADLIDITNFSLRAFGTEENPYAFDIALQNEGSVKVLVYKHDISLCHVDAVVSVLPAKDKEPGRIATAIEMQVGPDHVSPKKQRVKKLKNIIKDVPDDRQTTFKYVIYAKTPKFKDDKQMEQDLRKCIQNIFRKAKKDDRKIESIALPALCLGLVRPELCFEILVDETWKACADSKQKRAGLRQIHLIGYNESCVYMLNEFAGKKY